jgi:hypothetical protein
MEVNANKITTMGIISNEVYDAKYFTDDAVASGLKIKGTKYKVLDHTHTNRKPGIKRSNDNDNFAQGWNLCGDVA